MPRRFYYLHTTLSAQRWLFSVSNRAPILYEYLPEQVMHGLILLAMKSHLNRCLQHVLTCSIPISFHPTVNSSWTTKEIAPCPSHAQHIFCLSSVRYAQTSQPPHTMPKCSPQTYVQVQVARSGLLNRLIISKKFNQLQKDVAVGQSRQGWRCQCKK